MNPSVRLDLSLEEANLILEALGEQPYARVHALIAKIHQQAMAQLGGGSEGAPSGSETTP